MNTFWIVARRDAGSAEWSVRAVAESAPAGHECAVALKEHASITGTRAAAWMVAAVDLKSPGSTSGREG